MSITLTPDQQAWLNAHVASGEFPSVEDGARQLIVERIAERSIEDNDLAWAGPYVAEALAERAAGKVISLEEHEARNDVRLTGARSA